MTKGIIKLDGVTIGEITDWKPRAGLPALEPTIDLEAMPEYRPGKLTISFEMKMKAQAQPGPRRVRRMWWEDDDLCVELADGQVERYVDAVPISCEHQLDHSGVVSTPIEYGPRKGKP
jgi:hypothetical protein